MIRLITTGRPEDMVIHKVAKDIKIESEIWTARVTRSEIWGGTPVRHLTEIKQGYHSVIRRMIAESAVAIIFLDGRMTDLPNLQERRYIEIARFNHPRYSLFIPTQLDPLDDTADYLETYIHGLDQPEANILALATSVTKEESVRDFLTHFNQLRKRDISVSVKDVSAALKQLGWEEIPAGHNRKGLYHNYRVEYLERGKLVLYTRIRQEVNIDSLQKQITATRVGANFKNPAASWSRNPEQREYHFQGPRCWSAPLQWPSAPEARPDYLAALIHHILDDVFVGNGMIVTPEGLTI